MMVWYRLKITISSEREDEVMSAEMIEILREEMMDNCVFLAGVVGDAERSRTEMRVLLLMICGWEDSAWRTDMPSSPAPRTRMEVILDRL